MLSNMICVHAYDQSRPSANEHVRALGLDALSEALTILSLDDVVLDVNPAFSALTGFERGEILGQRGAQLFDLASEAETAIQAALRDGCWSGEIGYRRKGGERYLGRTTLAIVSEDGRAPSYIFSLHRDITAYRRTADVQRRAALDVQQLIGRLPDAIAVVKDDSFVFGNEAMLKLVGAESSDGLVGLRLSELAIPKDWATVMEVIARARNRPEPPDPVEVRLLRFDQRVIQAELQFLRVSFDGSDAVAVVARDLSALRQIDLRTRETDRMVAIGTLAAGIAHEINTPIQYIGDSTYFLRESYEQLSKLLLRYRSLAQRACLDAEAKAELEGISAFEREVDAEYLEKEVPAALRRTLDGTDRVARIVRAMKEFGHPGSEKPAPAELDELVRNVVIVATNEIKYVADVELDLGNVGCVTCLAGAVNQVLLNLVVNAAHAIGEKMAKTKTRGRITLRTRDEGTMVHVMVQDTGTGIPPEIQSRIFDPFFTTKAVGKGTGQGLAIARSIVVERHGGRLWFDTEPGVGTVFHFTLPAEGEGTSDLNIGLGEDAVG